MCFKKTVKTRENFRIYVQISGPNSNFRTFQDKFQEFQDNAQACTCTLSLDSLPPSIHTRSSSLITHLP